jgi:tetratricopeptide (TPR) repeat protein
LILKLGVRFANKFRFYLNDNLQTICQIHISIALSDLGENEEAIDYYDKVLNVNPNHTTSLNNKGIALNDLGKHGEAITYYDRILAIDQNDTSALNDKGLALYNLGKYEEAIVY